MVIMDLTTKTEITFEYRVLDKDGNPKPIWQENKVGRFLRERLGFDIQRRPFGKLAAVMTNTATREF